ncbi:MAG: HD-GYP domain-containing protein [Candidatus Omnitrophota bacterium]|nr:HD-GYP domain-containing protein [Candidatus Omnitrophota bacterium]
MKKYKNIFYSFHSLYRLGTSYTDVRHFIVGVCRVYKNTFKADKITMVFKNMESSSFMKVYYDGNKQCMKRGGISILNKWEREILSQERGVFLSNRLIYPFSFVDTFGMIYIKRKSPVFTDLEKQWFLSLSEEASMGLKIFSLYREEKKILLSYIQVLTKCLEQYTPVHTQSIIRLIRSVGKKLKLSELETKSLEYASLLHDVGEIQLPSKLLKKERALTEEEFKIIMKHPRKGVKLIKDLDILRPVVPIILHHHERYDGKGYPSKLKKEQIPLGSRILSVIDSFHAMFFGRPYKNKMDLEGVENELKKQVGKQFDPKIVDVFLKVLKRKDIRKYLQSFQ